MGKHTKLIIISGGVLLLAIVIVIVIVIITSEKKQPAPVAEPEPEPINCELSMWSGCNKPCGGGTTTRTILKQPQYGGKACGALTEACNTHECPVETPMTWNNTVVTYPSRTR